MYYPWKKGQKGENLQDNWINKAETRMQKFPIIDGTGNSWSRIYQKALFNDKSPWKWHNIPVPFRKRELLRGEIAAMFSLTH